MIDTTRLRELLRLALAGKLSCNAIASMLGMSHNTVTFYKRRAVAAGLTALAIDQMDDGQLVGKLCKRYEHDPDKRMPDWDHVTKQLQTRTDVTLMLLWVEYSEAEPEAAYSYSQYAALYRDWLRKRGVSMRQVHRAGEKLFVDYAGKPDTRPLLVNQTTGESRRVELFVAVLGASSYVYAEATLTQQLPDWIASHTRALEFFGGVTEIIVPDQLKSAVVKRENGRPIINRAYLDFAKHYDTFIDPARVRKPRDKAKAEVGVQVVSAGSARACATALSSRWRRSTGRSATCWRC